MLAVLDNQTVDQILNVLCFDMLSYASTFGGYGNTYEIVEIAAHSIEKDASLVLQETTLKKGSWLQASIFNYKRWRYRLLAGKLIPN